MNNIVLYNIAESIGNFYVYNLCKPDNTPFYIGIGQWNRKPVGERYEDHIKESFNPKDNTNLHKTRTIQKIINAGDNILVNILFQYNSVEEAFLKEIELIATHGRRVDNTGILTNLTLGGDGVIGWEHPSGEDHPWYGRHHLDSSKEKMRIAKLGTTVKTKTRISMSESHQRRLNNMTDYERAFRNSNPKKLTESDVKYIRSVSINNRKDKEILAAKFDISAASINDVLARRSYKWVA